MFSSRNNKGEAVKRFNGLLEKCKDLSKMRNLIAHNPLLIEISFIKGKRTETPKICRYLDREKKITKSQLVEFCKNTSALADELEDAIHAVLVETFQKEKR